MKIVVIIPTYNEYVNIEKLIPLLETEVIPEVKTHDLELLIADDESPDKTADLVRSFMKKWKNIHLLVGDKKGLGAAYVRAMRYAMDTLKAGAVIEFDADFQHDPRDIPRLIAALDKGADYVIGSRYIKGGQIPKEWGLHRKLMSFFGGQFARIVLLHLPLHDLTSGYKLTKTEYLKKVDLDYLYSQYYAYKIHILHDVIKAGAKVVEVPVIFYERKEGSSKIAKKDLFDSFYVVLRLRLRDSARFIKFLVVGGTGFIIQLLLQELTAFLGGADWLAVGIGAESAIISNFLFNHFWTFRDTANSKNSSSFFVKLIKFNTTSLASIVIQVVSIAIFEKLLGTKMTILSHVVPTRIVVLFPTIIFLVIPLNYLIYNRIVWKTHELHDEKDTRK